MIGLVYKITNEDESIVYVGSTIRSIKKRFDDHMTHYKRWINGKHPCTAMIFHSFKAHGIDKFKISIASEHEVETLRQLHAYEQLLIESTICVNKRAAYRSEQEIKAMKEKYREEHKEYNRARAAERVECTCGKAYTRSHKVRHKQSNYHRQRA